MYCTEPYNHMMLFFVDLDRLARRIDNELQPDVSVDWLLEEWRLGRGARKDIRDAAQRLDKAGDIVALSAFRDLDTWDRNRIPYYCKILQLFMFLISI